MTASEEVLNRMTILSRVHEEIENNSNMQMVQTTSPMNTVPIIAMKGSYAYSNAMTIARAIANMTKKLVELLDFDLLTSNTAMLAALHISMDSV